MRATWKHDDKGAHAILTIWIEGQNLGSLTFRRNSEEENLMRTFIDVLEEFNDEQQV